MGMSTSTRGRWLLDPRSLVAFRFLLGLTLCMDLLDRLSLVQYMFSESGFLPSSSWHSMADGSGFRWSLHLGLPYPLLVQGLVLVQVALSISLALGFRPGLSAALGWVLLLSLNFRNPVVTYGGDFLATKLLLVASLVPWQWERSSVTRRVVVTLLVLVQVACLYTGAGLSKLRVEMWVDGTALSMAFGMHAFASNLGGWLSSYTGLLRVATVCTPWLQVVAPLAAFWHRARPYAVLLLLSLNAGIFMTLHVGWFMPYATSLLLAALPGFVWDRIGWRLPPAHFPHPRMTPCLREAPVLVATVLVLAVFVSTAAENAVKGSRLPLPEWAMRAVNGMDIYQRWNMFGRLPKPPGNWFVSASRTKDGKWINILDGGSPVRWDLPDHSPQKFLESSRWRSAMPSAFGKKGVAGNTLVLRAMVEDWNARHPENQVTAVKLFKLQSSARAPFWRVAGRARWPSSPEATESRKGTEQRPTRKEGK